MANIPFDYCENCLAPIETEDEVQRYGDFNLCSQECVDEFKNLLASYQMRSNRDVEEIKSRAALTKVVYSDSFRPELSKNSFYEEFRKMNEIKPEHFVNRKDFLRKETDGK